MFYTSDRNGSYGVSYADLPIPDNESPLEVQSHLDGFRDGHLADIGGKLVSESRIQLNGKYPGRDIHAAVPSGQAYAHSQVFIVNKRLYVVLVVGVESWVDSSETKKFLDSFALISK